MISFFFLITSEINGFIDPIAESDLKNFTGNLTRKIIQLAKNWPFYFCRLFPVAVRALNNS